MEVSWQGGGDPAPQRLEPTSSLGLCAKESAVQEFIRCMANHAGTPDSSDPLIVWITLRPHRPRTCQKTTGYEGEDFGRPTSVSPHTQQLLVGLSWVLEYFQYGLLGVDMHPRVSCVWCVFFHALRFICSVQYKLVGSDVWMWLHGADCEAWRWECAECKR